MARAVEEILPLYGDRVRFTKVEYQKSKDHSKRFLELSICLYGEDAVRNGFRLAPIPSLFINGKLVFDAIPVRDELEIAIETFLEGRDY
jgi:hypothetical protein